MHTSKAVRFQLKPRWLGYGLALLFALALITLAVKINRAIQLAEQLEGVSTSLQSNMDEIAGGDDITARLTAIRSDTSKALNIIAELRQTIWPFGDILKPLAWVPVYGHDLAAFPPSLDMAEGLLRSAQHIDASLSPLLETFPQASQSDSDHNLPVVLLQTVTEHRADLAEARAELNRATMARQQIGDISELHPTLQRAISKSDTAIDALDRAMQLLNTLPELLGADRPHHILILIQNADELRPTGGFITYTIYMVIEDGKIVEQEAIASTGASVDLLNTVVYDVPPEPMKRYMDMPIWLFRDTNWSPDFPTSATKAAQLYSVARDVPIDTVIGLNQFTIQSLLRELGPIALSDGSEINSKNAVGLFRELWDKYRAAGGSVARKDFIPELAPKLVDKALTVRDVRDIISKFRAIKAEATRGDLLVYSTRPSIQAMAELTGFDGAISAISGDYVYVVDTNISANKADLNIKRDLSYHVSLSDPTQPYAILQLGYANSSVGQYGLACPVKKEPLTNYLQEADDCYVDYLRLYLSEDATVLSSPKFDLPANFLHAEGDDYIGQFRHLLGEWNKEVYGMLMIVNPGETLRPSFVIQLSPKCIFELQPDGTVRYDLLVKRQPGVAERTSTIVIDLPEGAQVVLVNPRPTSMSDRILTFKAGLDDSSLKIHLVLQMTPDMQKRLLAILPAPTNEPAPTATPRLVPTDMLLPTPATATTPTVVTFIMATTLDRVIMRQGPRTVWNGKVERVQRTILDKSRIYYGPNYRRCYCGCETEFYESRFSVCMYTSFQIN